RVARTAAACSSRRRMRTITTMPTTAASTKRTRVLPIAPSNPRRRSHGKKTFCEAFIGSLHEIVHLDERHQNREGDESDRAAKEYDDERLEQPRQRLHARVDLRVVGLRDVLDHRLELAGLLAD